MVVDELIQVIKAKVDEAEFADVFALFDHVTAAALKMIHLINDAVEQGFSIIDEVAKMGDALADNAERLGISTEALQKLGYAAQLSGSNAEELTASLGFLAKAAAAAADGSAEALKAFNGVRLKNAEGQIRPLEDLFADLSDQFAKMPNGAAKADRAMALFGRSGKNLVGTLNRGKAGLQAFGDELQAAGGVLSAEAVANSEKYGDSLDRLGAAFFGLKEQFATPLIGKVTDLFERLRKLVTGPGFKRAVDALSVGFGRLVDTLALLVDAFTWLTSNEDVVTVAIFTIASAMAALALFAANAGAAFVAAGIAAAGAWIAAAAPFLALGALIVLITDDLYTFAEGGDSVLGRLIGWLDSIDPTSTPLIEMLKSAASLIFDLTDTNKWERLGKAIWEWLIEPLRAISDSIPSWLRRDENKGKTTDQLFPGLADPLSLGGKGVIDSFMQKFPGVKDPFSTGGVGLGNSLASKLPGIGETVLPTFDTLNDWDSRAGDFVSGRVNSFGMGQVPANNTRVNAPITIDARGASDPAAVGEAVRQVVREELGNAISDAQGAYGG